MLPPFNQLNFISAIHSELFLRYTDKKYEILVAVIGHFTASMGNGMHFFIVKLIFP